MIIYMGYDILLGVRKFVGEYETIFAVRYIIWSTKIYMGGYCNLYGGMTIYVVA